MRAEIASIIVIAGWVTAALGLIAGVIVFLLRKEYTVRGAGYCKPLKAGDIILVKGVFTIKTRFGPKQHTVTEIQQETGYEEIDMGLEHHSCIDLIFANGDRFLFCGTNTSHQQMINELLETYLGVSGVNWDNDVYGPFSTDKTVLYQRK